MLLTADGGKVNLAEDNYYVGATDGNSGRAAFPARLPVLKATSKARLDYVETRICNIHPNAQSVPEILDTL